MLGLIALIVEGTSGKGGKIGGNGGFCKASRLTLEEAPLNGASMKLISENLPSIPGDSRQLSAGQLFAIHIRNMVPRAGPEMRFLLRKSSAQNKDSDTKLGPSLSGTTIHSFIPCSVLSHVGGTGGHGGKGGRIGGNGGLGEASRLTLEEVYRFRSVCGEQHAYLCRQLLRFLLQVVPAAMVEREEI